MSKNGLGVSMRLSYKGVTLIKKKKKKPTNFEFAYAKEDACAMTHQKLS